MTTRMVQARFLTAGDNIKVDGRWEMVRFTCDVSHHGINDLNLAFISGRHVFKSFDEEVETR